MAGLPEFLMNELSTTLVVVVLVLVAARVLQAPARVQELLLPAVAGAGYGSCVAALALPTFA
jgi:hypothetical protein